MTPKGLQRIFSTVTDLPSMPASGIRMLNLEELPDIKRIQAGGVPLVLAENMVLGTDHAQIGAKILEAWAFPPDVIRAVRWHHDPEAADGSRILIDIVHPRLRSTDGRRRRR